jgi:hypothetical protein
VRGAISLRISRSDASFMQISRIAPTSFRTMQESRLVNAVRNGTEPARINTDTRSLGALPSKACERCAADWLAIVMLERTLGSYGAQRLHHMRWIHRSAVKSTCRTRTVETPLLITFRRVLVDFGPCLARSSIATSICLHFFSARGR